MPASSIAMHPVAGPVIEPVNVAEARLHLRLDTEADDAHLATLVQTSRLQLEALLGLALITQTWRLEIAGPVPREGQQVPLRPLQAVNAVSVVGADGSVRDHDAQSLRIDDATIAPVLCDVDAGAGPGVLAKLGVGERLSVVVAAGYGDAAGDVPAPLRQAILLLVAHWYERRLPGEPGSLDADLNAALAGLLQPFRKVRL